MKKILFSLLLAFTFIAPTAFAEILPTVRPGSSRARIAEVQDALNFCANYNLVVDGRWGSRTESAVRRFQSQNGIAPVGFVGPRTAAALNECVYANDSYQDDDTPNTSGATTNNVTNSVVFGQLLCPNGATVASNCTATPTVINNNAVLCPNGLTLASNCTQSPIGTVFGNNTSTSYGTEGSLVSFNRLGSYNNTRVSAGESDVRILGLETTARDADQKIDSVIVSFYNSSNSSSKRITRYASEVSIWLDGVRLGTKSANAYSDESGDVYTYRFTGLNGTIRRDQRGQIIAAVTPQNVIDSLNADTDSWAVSFGTSTTASGDGNFITAVSPNGRYRDYGTDSSGSFYTSTVDFQRAGGLSSDQRYRVTTAANNPVTRTIQVSRTSDTTEQLLLAFDVRSENASMKLQRLPVTITTNSIAGVVPNVEAIVKVVRLYANGVYVTSESVPAGSNVATITFGQYGRLNYLMSANSTVRFEVRADLNDIEPSTGNTSTEFDEGDTVRADYTTSNVSATIVELDNFNEDNVQNRSGSAVGQDQTLRSLGAQITMGTATTYATTNGAGDTLTRTITIPVSVRAFDETAYMSQFVQNALTVTGTESFTFTFEDTANAVKVIPNSATISSVGTPIQNGVFRIDPGTERQFVINIVMSGTSGQMTNQYRVQMNQIQTFSDSSLTLGQNVQQLLPQNSFETNYYTLSLN